MTVREYLGNLVKAQLNNEAPVQMPKEFSFEQILDIAVRNHMDYLVLGAMVKDSSISEENKARMRSRVVASVMRTGKQVAEIKKIEKCFEENHIKNQPMKGSRMKFIYPSPEMREMSDIDILIDKDCMEKAEKLLMDNGYELVQAIKHHDIFKKQPYVVVEAHRSLYDKTVDKGQYDYFSSFERTELLEGKEYTYDFKKEDFYVYMIAHMAKHFYAMGCGIRNLVDIYVFLEKFGRDLDRQYLEKELDNCGIAKFNFHMERLAYIWLGNESSDDFYDSLFQYMMDSGIYGKDENGIWNKFAEEKMAGKSVSRGRLKLWYYFPPIAYMAEYYPWLEDHHFLLPIAWMIRAYRGIFKKKGVHKREMLQDIGEDRIKTYQNIYQNMELHFKKK